MPPRLRKAPNGRRTLLTAALALALAGGVIAGEADDPLGDLKSLIKERKFAEAESGARSLLARVEAKSGADSVEAARVLDILVESLWRGGKGGEIETRELAERAVTIKERVLGSDHLDVATSLSNFGTVLWWSADFAASRLQHERGLAIREKTLGPDHPDVATSLTGIATALYETGDYAKAVPLLDRALRIWETAFGPDHPDVASTLNRLAIVLQTTGDYAAARPLLERALAIREKTLGPDHPNVATSLNDLAILLQDTGDYAAARPLYERAIALGEKTLGADHPFVSNSLNNFAGLLYDMGDYAAVRPLAERALSIREKALGPDHPDVAASLNNLAALFHEMGDSAAARPLADRALAIWEKALGPDHPDVAIGLSNLARIFRDTGDYAAARPLFERSLKIREKALGPDDHYVATSLRELAILLHDTGDYAAARPLLERCLEIRRKSLGPDHPDVAECLIDLAQVHAVQGEVAGALEAALEAERIARDHLRLTGRSLSERQALRYAAVRKSGLDLALTLAGQGLDDASRRRALDAVVRSRAVVFDEMAARHRVIGSAADPVGGLTVVLTRARTRLANLVVRGLGDQTPEAYRKLLDEAREEKERAERALAAASADFAREFSRSRLGVEEVAASLPPGSALVAIARYNRFDLVRKSATKADAAASRRTTVPGEHRAATPLVERSVKTGEVPSYLAVVLRSGEQSPEVADLGPAEKIDKLVARWREEASGGPLRADRGLREAEAAYREAGAALRKRVWDPLGSAIKNSTRVFIIPDGSLNLVNVAALPVDEGGYLVERGPLVHYLSTERDLVSSDEIRHGEGILVLGSPAYDATSLFAGLSPAREPFRPGQSTHMFGAGQGKPRPATSAAAGAAASVQHSFRGELSTCDDFRAVRFAPLPGSKREADEVADLLKRRKAQGVRRLTGSAASEAAFKEKGPGRRMLHLATHGFFLGEQCASALDDTRPSGGSEAREQQGPPPVVGENPLLLSGLALAGANHRASAGPEEEDGILTAEEVAAMDLSGVDWVVLSACDTGVGEFKAGEGMFGLRRAFQVAGARTVITSLWSVEDEATRAWMRNLYQERLSGASTAEAVRNASRRMIESLKRSGLPAHAYYWAGFVAVGDWK